MSYCLLTALTELVKRKLQADQEMLDDNSPIYRIDLDKYTFNVSENRYPADRLASVLESNGVGVESYLAEKGFSVFASEGSGKPVIGIEPPNSDSNLNKIIFLIDATRLIKDKAFMKEIEEACKNSQEDAVSKLEDLKVRKTWLKRTLNDKFYVLEEAGTSDLFIYPVMASGNFVPYSLASIMKDIRFVFVNVSPNLNGNYDQFAEWLLLTYLILNDDTKVVLHLFGTLNIRKIKSYVKRGYFKIFEAVLSDLFKDDSEGEVYGLINTLQADKAYLLEHLIKKRVCMAKLRDDQSDPLFKLC